MHVSGVRVLQNGILLEILSCEGTNLWNIEGYVLAMLTTRVSI